MTDRTVVYRIQADVQQAKAQIAAFGASVKKSADDITGATKEGAKFRQGLDTLGGAAGKVGLVAAAGLGAAVLKAADFGQAMSRVQAATHESASAMEDLRQAALDAGADTAFSATEAAAGIENLAKAGISTADILGGGLAGALDLAAAGGMEVADAAEAAAGAMAQFKLEGSEATHVADLLAAGAGKAQGDVSDMVMALKQAGTVSAQTGLSIEETTGTLAAMAEQSLLGSDAGTSFKTMLASLTPNSEKAKKAMEQYNIQAFDAQGNFVGMTELAGQLQAGLGGLTNEQRAMTLETIFGSDAVRAAAIVYDNGADGIQSWIDKTDDAGYAAETAAIKLDNLKGDLEALGGSLETALIGTGESSQGPLRSLTQSLTDTVNAYNNLGEGAKSGVAATLAATAAIGGGLFVFSKMVRSIAATREAMSQLGIASNVTKGQVAGLAKGAGGVLLVAGAVTALGNALAEANGAALDSSDLQRNLEALSLGNGDATLDRLISDLEIVNQLSGDLTEPLKETVTLFGVFGNTNLDNAKDNLSQMDEALAGLVESGNGDKAAEVFERIMEASDLDDAEVNEYFDSYQTALENAGAAGEGFATSTQYAVDTSGDLVEVTTGLVAATSSYQYAAAGAAEEVESFGDKVDRLNEALDGRAGLRDYEAALDDFTASLKENGNNFDINTEKGRANQAALDNIASSALNAAQTMEGADRQKFLSSAIDDIRTMGQNMGLPKSEIKALIALLVEANKKDVKPKVDVDAAPAFASFRAIDEWMTALDGKRATTYVDTVRTVTGPHGAAVFSRAQGGAIYGPGTATSDSIPVMASDGEYMIKAAAVDHYGVGFFDRANAMHLADGGEVTKRKRRNLNPDSDMDTIFAQGFSKQILAMTRSLEQAAQKQVNAAEVGLLAAEDQQEAAKKGLEAAEQNRDTVQQLRDSLAASVSSQFSSSLTGRGLAGLSSTLGTDINGGATMDATLRALTAAGLDTTGPAAGLFQELAASNDLRTANELLASPDMIATLEAQYAQRAAINSARGSFAADASFGASVAAAQQAVLVQQQVLAATTAATVQMQANLDRQSAQLDTLTSAVREQAQRIGEVINDTAHAGVTANPRGR